MNRSVDVHAPLLRAMSACATAGSGGAMPHVDPALLFWLSSEKGQRHEFRRSLGSALPIKAAGLIAAARRLTPSVITLGHNDEHIGRCHAPALPAQGRRTRIRQYRRAGPGRCSCALAQRKDAMIRARAEALHILATPLLPVAEGMVGMFLIGAIDSARAQQVTETLLEGVVRHRARAAILDVTGVGQVDLGVVRAIVSAAPGVRLLGTKAIVTGIRPNVAEQMVELAADVWRVVMLGDLKSGSVHAIAR